LIVSKTIAQGDTRQSGLKWILACGGAIYRAVRRIKWIGDAAVVVSTVHIGKSFSDPPSHLAILDEKPVSRISAFLVDGPSDDDPARLNENAGKAFQGSILLGMGFTFDDIAARKGTATAVMEMDRLIVTAERNRERLKPYLGGEELHNEPRHQPH
jgi:hypothetical protein